MLIEMNGGSLGESDGTAGSSERSFHNGNRTLNANPCSTSKTAETSVSNRPIPPVKGAALRKLRRPRRREHVLREIKKLQRNGDLLIPKLPFGRLVREISLQTNPEITRYSLTALEALQEASEMYLTQVLQDAYYLTMHRKCVTLSKADLTLLRYLKIDCH